MCRTNLLSATVHTDDKHNYTGRIIVRADRKRKSEWGVGGGEKIQMLKFHTLIRFELNWH